MPEKVSLQLDVGSLSGNILSATGTAHALLEAVSADNVSPLAVSQTESLGGCFQSNGLWAAKLPDLLARTSSVRLERLSAWIGWARGDTGSYMSQSSGGRTAALLCLALGNLYAKERCGMIIFELSRRLLPLDRQHSSIVQLANVSSCLERKLDCLGFGNHLGLQLTRLRQCFFEAGFSVPRDLGDTPTEETMQEFLVNLHQALQDESLLLRYCGTRSAGTIISFVMCLCPDDVRIEVEGEVLLRGQRDSVIFCVQNGENNGAGFHIESKIGIHNDDFRKHYIRVLDWNCNANLKFSWTGSLSSYLDVALAKVGARLGKNMHVAVANFIASVAEHFTADDWCSCVSGPGRDDRIAKEGLRTLLGANYEEPLRNSLRTVLVEPSEVEIPKVAYEKLRRVIDSYLPITKCSCSVCGVQEPWDMDKLPKRTSNMYKNWKCCPVALLWAQIGCVVHQGILSLLVRPESNPPICVGKSYQTLTRAIWSYLSRHLHSPASRDSFTGSTTIHNSIMAMLEPWPIKHYLNDDEETPPIICRSSKNSTIFPRTLQYPSMENPWSVEYLLIDGIIHYGSDCYDAILCAPPEKGAAKGLQRAAATRSLRADDRQIKPSGLGEHNELRMTLRPDFVEGIQYLLLRSTIHFSTRTVNVNFLDIQLGFLSLSRANECQHSPRSPIHRDEYGIPVILTSVISPVPRRRDAVGITLTHWNEEAQFLCCTVGFRTLYQTDCCLECAVTQARGEGFRLVIGGSA